jgi:hypothetical protein
MSDAREQLLRDERRTARLAALTQARRARRRELAFVEEYLARVRFNRAQPRRAGHALAPEVKR